MAVPGESKFEPFQFKIKALLANRAVQKAKRTTEENLHNWL